MYCWLEMVRWVSYSLWVINNGLERSQKVESSQTWKHIKCFSIFDLWMMLRYWEHTRGVDVLNTRGVDVPVSHSACFSDCRMHQEVLILPSVLQKSKCTVQESLLILKECSSITKSSTTVPKYWCKNMTSRGRKTQRKWAFFMMVNYKPFHFPLKRVDWFAIQFYRGRRGRSHTFRG